MTAGVHLPRDRHLLTSAPVTDALSRHTLERAGHRHLRLHAPGCGNGDPWETALPDHVGDRCQLVAAACCPSALTLAGLEALAAAFHDRLDPTVPVIPAGTSPAGQAQQAWLGSQASPAGPLTLRCEIDPTWAGAREAHYLTHGRHALTTRTPHVGDADAGNLWDDLDQLATSVGAARAVADPAFPDLTVSETDADGATTGCIAPLDVRDLPANRDHLRLLDPYLLTDAVTAGGRLHETRPLATLRIGGAHGSSEDDPVLMLLGLTPDEAAAVDGWAQNQPWGGFSACFTVTAELLPLLLDDDVYTLAARMLNELDSVSDKDLADALANAHVVLRSSPAAPAGSASADFGG